MAPNTSSPSRSRHPASGPFLGLALLGVGLLLAAHACSSITLWDDPGGIVVYDAGSSPTDGGIRPTKPVPTGEIAPLYGHVSPKELVEYYYFGEVDSVGGKVATNPIYFFYDEDGEPLFRLSEDGAKLVGWHPIVDVIPTRQGYSPFWRVVRVRVKGHVDKAALDALRFAPTAAKTCQMDAACPAGQRCLEDQCVAPLRVGLFDLDGLKSLATLEQSLLVRTETDLILNCPVVDADSKLLKGLAAPDTPLPKIQLWYRRLKAYCQLMEGGKDLLGDGLLGLPRGAPPPVGKAYFIRQELDFGTSTTSPVLPARNLVITMGLPGSASYTPLVKELDVTVDKNYVAKDLRQVSDIFRRHYKVKETGTLHDLVVRGTVPACTSDTDCAGTGGKVDPPLRCSPEIGYCSPPPARLYEECRRGVKECDVHGGPNGARLGCWGLLVRKKSFCFLACDSSQSDTNPDKEIDSRCGSVRGFRCLGVRRTDLSRPNGICIRFCNSRAGDADALLKECESPGCGDGKLQAGETCDDGNKKSGDGCNEFCTLSTFDRCDKNSDCKGSGQSCKAPASGQSNTYCLPPTTKERDESVEKGKYRTTCMEYDYCWPPDERADWLGKKEASK